MPSLLMRSIENVYFLIYVETLKIKKSTFDNSKLYVLLGAHVGLEPFSAVAFIFLIYVNTIEIYVCEVPLKSSY